MAILGMEVIKPGAIDTLHSDHNGNQKELEIAAGHAQTNFSISELQQAYWLGEEGGLRLSTPQLPFEAIFASKLEVSELKNTLVVILERHPRQRSKVASDETQIVFDTIPSMEDTAFISYTGWTGVHNMESTFNLDSVVQVDVSDILMLAVPMKLKSCIHRVNRGFYINIFFRLLAVNGLSIRIVLPELVKLYRGQLLSKRSGGDYREYLVLREIESKLPDTQAFFDYWHRPKQEISPSLELPTIALNKFPSKARFFRRRFVFSVEEYRGMSLRAGRSGIILTYFLCAAYIDAIRMRSANKTIVLSVLTSKRLASDESFQYSVGNFGDTMLLEPAPASGSFRDRVTTGREQFLTAMEQTSASDVGIS